MRAALGVMILAGGVVIGVGGASMADAAVPARLSERFRMGNEWYRKGDYEKAVEQYRAILEAGYDSAALEYNLGNAQVHRNNLPEALAHYDRAAVLGLRDADWRANQTYVRRKLGQPKGHPDPREPFWVLSLTGWAFAGTVFLWIGAAGLLLSLWVTAAWMRRMGWAGVGLGVLCVSLWFWQFRIISSSWIVLRPSAVRFEPREEATVHYPLRPGEVVRSLRLDRDWMKVRSNEGRIGWMPMSHAGAMDPRRAYPLTSSGTKKASKKETKD